MSTVSIGYAASINIDTGMTASVGLRVLTGARASVLVNVVSLLSNMIGRLGIRAAREFISL